MLVQSFDQIAETINVHDGIYTFTMQELRDATGKNKLGVHVKREITETLASLGLSHSPAELPSYQHELVRVYTSDSIVASLLQAVLTIDAASDEVIRELIRGDAVSILNEIRNLICTPPSRR